jgi:DNA replication protein DnaC
MESLGDILRRLQQQNTFGVTDYTDSLNDESEDRDLCPICGGSGWVRTDVPVGHPGFGKAHQCKCHREAGEDQRLARLHRFSNMGPLTDRSFETLTLDGSVVGHEAQRMLQSAVEEARSYVEEPERWLVLTGASGSGKTHIAAAVANSCMERGIRTFFISVPDLLDHLRGSFAPGADIPYDELFELVKNVPLLVLDDMGAHSTTPWAQEKLYQVLNHRSTFRMSTVIILGQPLEEFDERLRTRFQDQVNSRIVRVAPDAPRGVTDAGPLSEEMLKRMTFQAFNVRGNRATPQQRQSLENALEAANSFAQDPDGWLVLMGDSGCGKTHLAVAIAGERLKNDTTPRFWPVPDLLDHLRHTFSPESRVTYDTVFEDVKRCPLLVLDDLGTETGTPWAREKLYQLIVHRHNSRLPTVITVRELEDPSQRDPIASRLNDSRMVNVIPIDAPDYRNQARTIPKRTQHGSSRGLSRRR